MGKDTGFLQWPRELPARRPVDERIGDSKELYVLPAVEQTRQQAGRCMDCGVPVCHQGCPLGNLIPDWNDAVFKGRHKLAFEALASTNNFPEFTGRLCPAPCEGACVLNINQDPVTIEEVEKQIIERAFEEGWVAPPSPTHTSGKRVAVVGSGPAGLAAAWQLCSAGHDVVVFEADELPGGLLRYGIPDFKMEKWVIDRRLDLMRQGGIEFRTNTRVGEDISFAALKADFDASLLCTGAPAPRLLDCPGNDLPGVVHAMEFLASENRRVAAGAELVPSRLSAKGKHVIILGGGDTGSDCLGTCHRHGAASVTQIELMPRPKDERELSNPWPQWPLVFRSSSSHEEGGVRKYGLATLEVLANDGEVSGLRVADASFEKGELVIDHESARTLEADLILLAIGFVGTKPQEFVGALEIALSPRQNIEVDKDFRTSEAGVYAAGDSTRGASLIVWAISEGREAARAIDEDLRTGPAIVPTRGRDRPFGGR